MSKYLAAILIAATLPPQATWGRAVSYDQSAFRQVIEGRYVAMRAAMDHHDASEIRALLAPGFASIDVDGSAVDADAMIASVQRVPLPTPGVKRVTTVRALTGTKTDLLVDQEYERRSDQVDVAGKPHAVLLNAHSRDRWVNLSGSWRLKETRTLEIALYKDGLQTMHKQVAAELAR